MAAPTDLLQQADTTVCLQFQSTLLVAPRPIEDFLPAEDQSNYVATLCRLIVLELEHRWRQLHQQQRVSQPGQTVEYPAGIEGYLTRFPRLRQTPDAVRVILQEEYRLRHRFGDQPSASEYHARYSAWVDAQTPFETVGPAAAPPAPTRDIPGYAILGELGHGGMGVVYRAEQTNLKRVVALKMILADRHAAADIRARFATEAEAVARLHHPNIVQIYDIGEHEGCPYFAMEFVAGGSLARHIRGSQLSPMVSARLVEALARAMHHAHQRGIVHRDLKPANVLLEMDDGHGRPDAVLDPTARVDLHSAIPKITDFGLAKRMDGDSGQTHTGAVMGTPSYMAPEQAAGNIHELGPLTDVYALGAILYESLTGRPPFLGATSLQTMQQVLHDEVVPPSRWRKVSRDLETICLKALAKIAEHRYASAQELAEDLARFQAGEPIRARREPMWARALRRTRRHRAAIGISSIVIGAALAVAYFALKDTRSSQAAALVREIEVALQERDWPEQRLEALESRLDELTALSPESAAELRPKLWPRYAHMVRDSFALQNRPILRAEDLPALEARITALKQRDAELGRSVQADFQKRLRLLQVQQVAAPFTDLATVFDPAQVVVQGDRLRIKTAHETLPTKVACLGNVEIDAHFDADWRQVGRIGLLVNWHERGDSYLFLFGVPDRIEPNGGDPVPPPAAETMAQQLEPKSELSLMIFRNGQKLRESRVEAKKLLDTAGLHLHASRQGDRLLFQVNDQAPAVYLDSFPLTSAAPGVFALQAPAGVGLERLRLASQALPSQPSPLERGDEQSARGQFAEALTEYRGQELAAAATELGQELRYKMANCLFRLQRFAEAAPLLEEVAAQTGDRWPPLAAVHLWIIYLQANQLDAVDAVMLDLTRRFQADQLASVIPLEVRKHLLTAYTLQSLGARFLRHDPLRIAKLERAIGLTDLLRARDYDRMHLRLSLLRALHFAGKFDDAIRLAEAMLQDPTLAGAWPDSPHRLLHWQIRTVEEYGWLMRLRGQPNKALAAVDQRLFKSPGDYRAPYVPLLVERARLLAFQKKSTTAQNDIEAFLQRITTADMLDYRYFAEAHLLLGFLRRELGDDAGARTAWQSGAHSQWIARWRQSHPEVKETPRLIFAGTQVMTNLVLNSLSGTVTKQDADDIVGQVIETLLDDPSAVAFKGALSIEPAQLHALWQSPRGLEAARSFAVRNVPWSQYQRLPTSVLAVAVVRHGALPVQPTADQDALAWKLAEDMQEAHFASGKVGKRQLFGLALAWNGTTGAFGWGGVHKTLPADLRGPIAYFLGQRYATHLNNAKEARQFYQTALSDALLEPRNPLLERLARHELAKLPPPK